MSSELKWRRRRTGEYFTAGHDKALQVVPNYYSVRKAQPSEGGGWLLYLNSEWHGLAGTLAEAKAQAQAHHNLICKYGTAEQRTTNELAAGISADMDAAIAANADSGDTA